MTQAHPIAARHQPNQAVRGMVPQTITLATRKRIEDAIEQLMLLLDMIDDDTDLEPWLGWPDPFASWQFCHDAGGTDDGEHDDDAELAGVA